MYRDRGSWAPEHLSPTTHYVTANGTLHNFMLVVNGKTVVAEDSRQLTHDVLLVLQDEHSCEVWSAWDIVGREQKERVMGSNVHLTNTTQGIHL